MWPIIKNGWSADGIRRVRILGNITPPRTFSPGGYSESFSTPLYTGSDT